MHPARKTNQQPENADQFSSVSYQIKVYRKQLLLVNYCYIFVGRKFWATSTFALTPIPYPQYRPIYFHDSAVCARVVCDNFFLI